jgi:hypothetical protein
MTGGMGGIGFRLLAHDQKQTIVGMFQGDIAATVAEVKRLSFHLSTLILRKNEKYRALHAFGASKVAVLRHYMFQVRKFAG